MPKKQTLSRLVEERLGGRFKYSETARYEAGPNSCEVSRFCHLETGLLFHLIPGGTYLRGSRESPWSFDKPVREVSIAPFLMGETPATQELWDRFGGEDGRAWTTESAPIEKVSVNDVKKWLKGFDIFRLPSEAEWEYAARAGAQSRYFWGEDMDSRYVWFKENSGMRTRSVLEHDQFRNAFGLVDVLGNVWEWCEDDFLENFESAPIDGSPLFVQGMERRHVYRGGAWNSRAPNVVLSNRNGRGVDYRFSMIGFRVAASLASVRRH